MHVMVRKSIWIWLRHLSNDAILRKKAKKKILLALYFPGIFWCVYIFSRKNGTCNILLMSAYFTTFPNLNARVNGKILDNMEGKGVYAPYHHNTCSFLYAHYRLWRLWGWAVENLLSLACSRVPLPITDPISHIYCTGLQSPNLAKIYWHIRPLQRTEQVYSKM